MIDVDSKTLTVLFKAVVLGCFAWLLRDGYKRPTREEVTKEIETKIKAAEAVTDVEIKHLNDGVHEIKNDVKELLKRESK